MSRTLPAALTALAAMLVFAAPRDTAAGVGVLANRTTERVYFAVPGAEGRPQTVPLDARRVMTLQIDEPVAVSVFLGGQWQKATLSPNSIHYFVKQGDGLQFAPVTLPGAPAGGANAPKPKRQPVAAVPLMVLVDENEPAVRKLWEKRLRDRLAAASEIFEHVCRVRFEVMAVGVWASDDAITRFERSLQEFETAVNPAPARLAIGFTSQYKIPKGRVHLGGTRGPMHSHILIREWSNHVTEPERLEILVHELGHYLGAIHSPESDSVMRATLGDRQAHARDFHIGFDPGNAMALFLVGEELRSGEVRSFHRLSEPTKTWLRAAYRAMAPAMPDDESAAQYLAALDLRRRSELSIEAPKPLVDGTRAVVEAIAAAAERNAALPDRPGRIPGIDCRATGDTLTELLVRRAASATRELPADVAEKAFLLGLGLGLDRTRVVRDTPLLSALCRQIESESDREARVAALGRPTMRGREDAAMHFAISCLLTALGGPMAAEAAGVAKELDDARGPSGFSFADLAANLSGIEFARQVLEKKTSLAMLSTRFAVADFVPPLNGLSEGIAWEPFVERYGSTADERFHRQVADIRQRIVALPGYRESLRSTTSHTASP